MAAEPTTDLRLAKRECFYVVIDVQAHSPLVEAMPVLGITGGIACGKSLVTGRLASLLRAQALSTDKVAADLLADDAGVRQALVETFGHDILRPGAKIDRSSLRQRVFSNAQQRAELERILHPKIRAVWLAAAAPYRMPRGEFFLVEIPLLFETRAEIHCDATITVACSRTTQLARIAAGRGLDADWAGRIIDAQMPIGEKIHRADYVLWNDGTRDAIEAQVERLAAQLRVWWRDGCSCTSMTLGCTSEASPII